MRRLSLYSLGIAAHWHCSDDRTALCTAGYSRPGRVRTLSLCQTPGCESLKRKKPVHCVCVGSLCELPS